MSTTPARRLLRLVAHGGAGQPIVLVHGFGADRLAWLANLGALTEAGAGAIFTLDLPGHGQETLVERSFVELAETLAATLAAAELRGCAIVGHSLGGAVALVLAATRPDLVRALVLIAPAGLGQGVDSEFLAHLPELAAPEEAEALLHRLVSRPRLIGKPMVTGLLRHLAGGDRRAALRRVAAILAEDQASVRDAVAQVARSALPRLVIWGAADRINRPDAAALQDFGGQLEIVPDAGHLPQVESATLVNNTILGFLVA